MNKFVKANSFIKLNENIYRVVAVDNQAYLTINCNSKNMPVWKSDAELQDGTILTEEEAFELLNINFTEDDLTANELKQAHERYTMIAGILPFI